MFIKDYKDCQEFIAGDGCLLREFLHPRNGDLKISYSFAHATVAPAEITALHRLKTSEVYYILEGRGLMFIDEESKPVYPKQAIYIPPYSRQQIKNIGDSDLKFICIVDPAWQPEDEEVFK